MIHGVDSTPNEIAALRAALAAEQLARREAEARASGAEAMVAHLKLLIAKLRHAWKQHEPGLLSLHTVPTLATSRAERCCTGPERPTARARCWRATSYRWRPMPGGSCSCGTTRT